MSRIAIERWAAPSIELCELSVWPAERRMEGPRGSRTIEPLVLALFLALVERAGRLVDRRQLFAVLWGGLAVGDDNLNRLVAVLRRTLVDLGVTSVRIDTVAGAGYILSLGAPVAAANAPQDVDRARKEAVESWRHAYPEPDYLRIALLSRATRLCGDEPELFGLLALLHRHAAEYGRGDEASDHVRSCETAARRALELDPQQPQAGTALVSVAPLYGQWSQARERLTELCESSRGHPVPENDLSVLEMATGQVRASKQRRDRLIRIDQLAAGYAYKSVYQHWSVGDRTGMDHVADRAMQLWPAHPAVWMARFWTLAYTERLPAARSLLVGSQANGLPPPMRTLLSLALGASASGQADETARATEAALDLAGRGPAQAIAALFALGLLRRKNEAFAVAERYYLHQGRDPVPLRPGRDHPTLNEQHRRLTQILFTPACAAMREDPRFQDMCHAIGLTRFWEETGITPDHLLPADSS